MPSISLDCLFVGLAVLVFAGINIGMAAMIDRHLTSRPGGFVCWYIKELAVLIV